ncbi:MAG: hypothetical protein K2N87_11795, partial [Eubacterium sp.]|nr:hypothetical protein [Eubacterium sp.]
MEARYYSHQDFAFTAKSVKMRKFSRERNQPFAKRTSNGLISVTVSTEGVNQCHLVSGARKVCPFLKRADVQVKI